MARLCQPRPGRPGGGAPAGSGHPTADPPRRWTPVSSEPVGPPVDAEPDPHLIRAGDALAAVADLLRRHATPPTSPEAARDADLVRRRIAECLLVGSHATALGLREHATRLRPARPGIAFEQPGVRLAVAGATLAQSRRLASELATFEAHAAHYLARAHGHDLQRRPEHFVDPHRLPHALAQWEFTAIAGVARPAALGTRPRRHRTRRASPAGAHHGHPERRSPGDGHRPG